MVATLTVPGMFLTGDHASRPAANAVGKGALYSCTDHDLIYQSDGSSWSTWADVSGSGSGLPATKNWISDNLFREDYPGSPNALDDEFEGSGSLDVKWTKVNDPASANALNQTDIPGYLHVGLLELGTDDWANLIQLYQTAPTGTSTMTYIAKIALANSSGTTGLTDAAEFAGIGIALINSANNQAVGVGLQFNDAATGGNDNLPLAAVAFEDTWSGFGSTVAYPVILPGTEVFVKLVKETTSAYTSANTYSMYVSGNGRIWQQIATGSKTFTTACDRVGFLIRRPKSATGTPFVEAIADFFRRTA